MNTRKPLFDYLLEKQKLKTISAVEDKVLKMYLQIYVLMQYFSIAINYCKTNKIQKEVQELYPAWTGYENYYWYTYHYEAFGNSLYSYTQVYKSILNFLKRKVENFPDNGEQYLNGLVKDKTIDKILLDRHDSVHQFGKWRSELSDELGIQNWKLAETKIAIPIINAYKRIKIFDAKITDFINKQTQINKED